MEIIINLNTAKPLMIKLTLVVRLKHYPAYPITIISLIIQKNLATKIPAKQESSLTAVRLKWDPPVTLVDVGKETVQV